MPCAQWRLIGTQCAPVTFQCCPVHMQCNAVHCKTSRHRGFTAKSNIHSAAHSSYRTGRHCFFLGVPCKGYFLFQSCFCGAFLCVGAQRPGELLWRIYNILVQRLWPRSSWDHQELRSGIILVTESNQRSHCVVLRIPTSSLNPLTRWLTALPPTFFYYPTHVLLYTSQSVLVVVFLFSLPTDTTKRRFHCSSWKLSVLARDVTLFTIWNMRGNLAAHWREFIQQHVCFRQFWIEVFSVKLGPR